MRYARIAFLTAYFGAFFLFFCALTLTRFYSFQVFYYDFGIFARMIWLLAHFQAPYIEHVSLGHILFLGDHFNPSIALMAPLFWVTSDLRILLVEQAFAIAASGVVMYKIARKSDLSFLVAIFATTMYLIFAGTLNPLVTDWHPEPTAGLFLLLFYYYFAYSQSRILPLVTALIFLGFKESNALTLMFLLVNLFMVYPKKRKAITIALAGISVWFLAVTRFIIPVISRHAYFYTPVFPKTIQSAIQTVLEKEKIHLAYISFFSYGFLPIAGGLALIPVVGELAIRFLPTEAKYDVSTLGSHYSVYLSIFLALAVLGAFSGFKKYFPKRKMVLAAIAGIGLLFSVYSARKIATSPINLSINRIFWRELKPNPNLLRFVQSVPKTGSIMSQNNLLPHFVGRRENVYLLTRTYSRIKPDIIVFDLTPGQNPNNNWSTNQKYEGEMKDLLLKDTSYRRVAREEDTYYLFLRN